MKFIVKFSSLFSSLIAVCIVADIEISCENDKNLIYKCRLIRNHGESYLLGKKRSYLPNMLGYNLRPTEFQATIGEKQINKWKFKKY